MKKQLLLGIAISIVLLVVGCGQKNEVNPAVNEETPLEEPIEKTVQTFGTVQTKKVKGIMIDLPATIDMVNVQEGDEVKKGDTLITLNLKEIEEQIKEKEDALKISKLELEKMIALEKNNTEIQQVENNLKSLNNEYEELCSELDKKETLLNEGAISQNEYDDFKKIIDLKEKDIENCKLTLDNLKVMKNSIEGIDIEIKKQNVAAQERTLKILKGKIKESGIEENKIICDIENGVVNKIYNTVGDRLNPEKQIMSILDMDTLVVKANVVEDFIKDVSIGNKAVIVPLADTTKQYSGKVVRIANMAVQENGETVIPVEIEIENTDTILLPNSNVNIKIIVE